MEHQPDHDQRRDRIGPDEAGEHDHPAGEERGDEPVQVGQDVLIGTMDVQA
jgi:hypothetical protein